MADFDTTALLASIRRRARSTNSTAPGYDNTSLLGIASEALLSEVAPVVAAERASFFRTTVDQTMVVGGSTHYFNTRCLGGVVSNFFRVDSTDNSVHPLVEWDEEDLQERDPTKQGTPQAFIIEGDRVRLYPVPSKADTLRQVYLRRPSRLVLLSTCGLVTSAPINLLTLGISPASAAALGFSAGVKVDFVHGTSAFVSVKDDAAITLVSADISLSFAAGTIPAEMNDGTSFGVSAPYYICPAGTSPFIQLPSEFFPLVAQCAACELLRPGRDKQIYRDALDERKRLEDAVYGVVADRVENQPGYLFGGDWPA